MPGYDRSGPMGAGPMTGGRRGLCGRAGNAYDAPAPAGYGYGRGMAFRRGFGGGFGWGRGHGRGMNSAYGQVPYPPAYGAGYPASKADEMAMLRADAEAMQKSLDAVQRRITELEKEESE